MLTYVLMVFWKKEVSLSLRFLSQKISVIVQHNSILVFAGISWRIRFASKILPNSSNRSRYFAWKSKREDSPLVPYIRQKIAYWHGNVVAKGLIFTLSPWWWVQCLSAISSEYKWVCIIVENFIENNDLVSFIMKFVWKSGPTIWRNESRISMYRQLLEK